MIHHLLTKIGLMSKLNCGLMNILINYGDIKRYHWSTLRIGGVQLLKRNLQYIK